VKEVSGFTPSRLCQIVRTCIDLRCGLIPAHPYADVDVVEDKDGEAVTAGSQFVQDSVHDARYDDMSDRFL
jgi:hypothetical protein